MFYKAYCFTFLTENCDYEYICLAKYNRVREHMTCDVIFVVAILEITLIYMVGLFPL